MHLYNELDKKIDLPKQVDFFGSGNRIRTRTE